MVTKTKQQGGTKGKKAKVKVLNLNKETVKNLTDGETRNVKGGLIGLSLVGGGSDEGSGYVHIGSPSVRMAGCSFQTSK